MYLPKIKKESGQSLIEILIAMAVFSILATAIFTLVASSYQLVSYNRARTTALHVAEQQLELIRNLPYDDVGTVGGIPSGTLPQDQQTQMNGLTYDVKTAIVYIDDPFDGTFPTDTLPTDYKRVRVEVNWQGTSSSSRSPVVLLTDVAPKGVESTAGGGTLSILVFDANSNPVPQAQVTITASAANPPVNVTLNTGYNGIIILPGAPPCIACYHIVVTKNGYTSDRTYSTTEIANPNNPDKNVQQGQLTEVSFTIDKISTLNIASLQSRANNFAPLANVGFHIKGTKTLGTDTSSNSIYKVDNYYTTDGSGLFALNNLEWDNYQISMATASSYTISGSNPILPLQILPNTNTNFSIALSNSTPNSLLIEFVDSSSNPIASVSAHLYDGSIYDNTATSGATLDPDFGQVFFSGLSSETYSLDASASGYQNYSNTVPVSGATVDKVFLSP